MTEHRPAVNGVLLLEAVQEQGTADDFPHHGEGPARELTARHGHTRSLPASLTPSCPVMDIFVLMGNIGGWGRGRRTAGWRGRMQDPEGRRRWG